jgi:Flp pilus assembly protein TadD
VRVLSAPADADARTELAVQQVNVNLSDQALYQLRRARVPAADTRQAATVEFTRAVALSQLGRQEEAGRSLATAERLDPQVKARVGKVIAVEPQNIRMRSRVP